MTAHNARRTEAFENSSYLYTFVCLHMWKTTAHTHSSLSLSEFYSPAEQEAGSAQSFRKIYTHIYAHRKLHVIPVLWVCVRVVLSEWMKWILSNSAPYRTSHRYAPHLLPFHFTGYFFLPKIQPWMHSFANFNVNYFECVWVFFLLMCQQHMQYGCDIHIIRQMEICQISTSACALCIRVPYDIMPLMYAVQRWGIWCLVEYFQTMNL